MAKPTRRTFIRWGVGAVAAGTIGRRRVRAQDDGFDFGPEPMGRVESRPATSIEASPLSVGFEVLDRKRFEPLRTYPHLARLGAKWARCQTGWNRCERRKGDFDFRWLDDVVDSLRKIGVQPWFNLGYGNKLYTPEKPGDTSVGWAPIFEPAAREGWLRFVRRLAHHFRDRVRHWEIWNEPNIRGFWKPRKPRPADYAALVAITAPEIRTRVPDAVIVGGALAGIPIGYLRGCLEEGLADHVDKVSYHPYRPVPEAGYRSQVQALRELLRPYGKHIALWQGENGCPSRGGEGSVGALSNLDWNESRQAKWLLRRILADLCLDIELTSYFHTVDLVGYRGQTNFKGLLRGDDYTPKRAYGAYQCLCALFDAQTRRQPELSLELVGQKKVHLWDGGFVRRGRALYAYWFPADLQKDWTPRRLTIRVTTSPRAAIRQPVLVDPMTRRLYPLEAAEAGERSMTFRDLPLLDYPLLVTDRAATGA
ncbi:MAG: GH39 family glycosyl hydrolase [Candidatus Brocadiia bacterium]